MYISYIINCIYKIYKQYNLKNILHKKWSKKYEKENYEINII